ncbi:sulfur carrier protein ThiS [Sediminibacterium soli]|uniref:sulfur carrier protein ThiS n=1 Tax=Sediminibacterium soli TaxID=2698829 RepID=UPI001379E5F9|nr:sulfur carrier protein ThiS [Sediminibacterium soli]NCI46418.1 sulfur carrier protein ThiS [Sediminibacterium soli]
MEILLNHQKREIISPSSIRQLLNDHIGDKQNGIAVAVNESVVPKSSWNSHMIQANDSILIIKATQGG